MRVKPLETHTKIIQIESRLSKFNYLSRQDLPGTADAYIYQKLQEKQRMPSKDKYENFYHWYIMMKQFAPTAIQKWIQKDKTLENDKLIVEILGLLDQTQNNIVDIPKPKTQYLMSVSVKKESSQTIKMVWKKFENSLKNLREKIMEFQENSEELRVKFKLQEEEFEKMKDMVSKWNQVQSIEIKKLKKETKF